MLSLLAACWATDEPGSWLLGLVGGGRVVWDGLCLAS